MELDSNCVFGLILKQYHIGYEKVPIAENLHPYDWTTTQSRDYLKIHLLGDSVGFITVYPSASDLTHWNSGISDNPPRVTPDFNDLGHNEASVGSCSWSRTKVEGLLKLRRIDTLLLPKFATAWSTMSMDLLNTYANVMLLTETRHS